MGWYFNWGARAPGPPPLATPMYLWNFCSSDGIFVFDGIFVLLTWLFYQYDDQLSAREISLRSH